MFKNQVIKSVVQTAHMQPLLRSATWHRNIMSEAPLRRVIDATKEIRSNHNRKSEGDSLWKNTAKYQFVNMRTNDQLINDGQRKFMLTNPPIMKKQANKSDVNVVRQTFMERQLGKIPTPPVYSTRTVDYTNDWSGNETTYNYMNQIVTAEKKKINSRRGKLPTPPVYSNRTANYANKLNGNENQNRISNTQLISDGKAVKIMKATHQFAVNRKKNGKMAKYNEAHESTQSKGICPIFNDDDDEPSAYLNEKYEKKQKKPATKSSWAPASSDEHYKWYNNYKEPKRELKYQPHYEAQLRKTDIAAGQQKQKSDVRHKTEEFQLKNNATKYETQSKNQSSEKPKKETVERKYRHIKKQLDYEKMEELTRRLKKGLTLANRQPNNETDNTNKSDEDWECNDFWFQ